MPIPDFLRQIRATYGRGRLLLPAVTGAVLDDTGRILTMQRADTGEWSLISGICEPHEAPARTMAREVFEEAGLRVVPDALLCVYDTPDLHYPNGDVAAYVTTMFRCRVVGGALEARDGEALDLAWRDLDELPAVRLLEWLPRPLAELLGTADARTSRAFAWDPAWLDELDRGLG